MSAGIILISWPGTDAEWIGLDDSTRLNGIGCDEMDEYEGNVTFYAISYLS